MPLVKGSSRKAVSTNIKTELAAGKPRAQSIAIALNTARGGKKAMSANIRTEMAAGKPQKQAVAIAYSEAGEKRKKKPKAKKR